MFIYYHLYNILLKSTYMLILIRELFPIANNKPVSFLANDSNENTVSD